MNKRRRTSFFVSLALLIFGYASFASCDQAPVALPTPSLFVPPTRTVLEAILVYFASRPNQYLKFNHSEVDRQTGYFVWRLA